MNTYAKSRALESGTIRMAEIEPGDTIYCRHLGNDYKFVPSRVVKVVRLFGGKVIRLSHESGAVTEHDIRSHARLA